MDSEKLTTKLNIVEILNLFIKNATDIYYMDSNRSSFKDSINIQVEKWNCHLNLQAITEKKALFAFRYYNKKEINCYLDDYEVIKPQIDKMIQFCQKRKNKDNKINGYPINHPHLEIIKKILKQEPILEKHEWTIDENNSLKLKNKYNEEFSIVELDGLKNEPTTFLNCLDLEIKVYPGEYAISADDTTYHILIPQYDLYKYKLLNKILSSKEEDSSHNLYKWINEIINSSDNDSEFKKILSHMTLDKQLCGNKNLIKKIKL